MRNYPQTMSEIPDIISASLLSPAVPVEVPALRLYQRPPKGQTARLFAVGDIGLYGRAQQTLMREGNKSLFLEVAPFLRTGDIVFGNLEGAFVERGSDELKFAALPDTAGALSEA